MAESSWQVGEKVWVYQEYSHGLSPTEGTVTKVGRKLVTVEWGGATEQFRMESGRINDNYGHCWVRTESMREELDRKQVALRVLKGKVIIDYGWQPTADQLERVAAIVLEES